MLISFLVGAGATLATTKQYRASAQIFVAIDSANDTSQLAQGNTFTQARVQSYTSIATSPAVMQPVVAKLGLNLTADELAAKVSADAPLNKVLINIHATDHSPELAAKIANAVADQFSVTVSGLDRTRSNVAVVKLSVTHPAAIPGSAVTPRTKLNLALALLVGLALGIGIAVLRETLDNTVKSPDVLNAVSEAPVMGIIPLDKKVAKNPVAFRADPHGLRAESFRQLRTNLQFVDVDSPPRIIAVTSALPGEGKSSTALNLAASLAEAGHKVCLIEADLRRPTLAKTMGLVGVVGLTTVLIGQVSVEEALQNIGTNLVVLTSGPVPPNPTELLASSQAKEVIRTIAENVDYTIIDTAPLLPVADAAEVAAIVEAVHGKLKFTHFENDTALDGVSTGLDFGADFDGRYAVADPTNFYVNSNISPHFPYAAQTWAAMWQRKSGERVDGAIAVDPSALSYFLAVTGPAKLADGSSITAANIVSKTQQEAYQRFPDNVQRKAYLLEVAESVDKQLLSGTGDSTKLVRAAARAAGERRLLVWSSHPDVQSVLMNSDFGGTVPDTSAPFVGLTVINASGNKLDYYLDRSVQWQRSGCGSSRSVIATVTLTNNAPASGLSTYVSGRNDYPSYATKPGDNRVLVSYFATEGATLEAATLNGKVKAVFPQRENGHPVHQFDVELPRGVPQTLTLSLTEPVGSGDPWLMKQPLVRPLQMSILDQKCP